MGATVLTNGTLLIDDELRAEAAEVLERMHDRRITGATLTLEDGSTLELPDESSGFITHVLRGLSQGLMRVTNFPEVLTTTTAADLLAVSRPTLMKWVSEGVIPSRRVGSHHRFDTADVIRLVQSRKEEREKNFADLRSWDEEQSADESVARASR